MRSKLRASLGLLGAISLLALSTPTANAADEINIDHVEASNGQVDLVLSIDGLPRDASADPDSVVVDVDGRTVDAEVKTVGAGDIERSTVLVLDASNSMRGQGKFESARAAINAFLDAAPDDVAIGLVAFAGDITATVEPTTDHTAVTSALDGLALTQGTSVYDAVLEGVRLSGGDGARSLLVLSDGADVSSSTTLEVAAGTAEEQGVIVDVVSLTNAGRGAELQTLADTTGGAVIPTDEAALARVFTDRADALAEQLLVSFEVPEGTSEDASIGVSLTAGGTEYRDSAFVAVGSAAALPNVVTSGKALVSKPVMLAGAAALALGLGGLLSVVLVGATDTRSSASKRLDSYFGGEKSKRKEASTTDLKQSAVALTDKVVSKDIESRVTQRLAGAGSALTAAEWVLLHTGIAVGSAVAALLATSSMAMSLLGLLFGAVLPWIYLKWRHSRRLNAFNGQLAETLGLMAGGLQAGLSLPQAIDGVVREGHQPIAGEFNRALVEQRLGFDITDALESVGERMESDDFGWVVMAIRIQREVGGNLAEILHTVADTLREREYLRRQVKALSAEGRLSGYILGGLPPAIFVYMTFANREYIELLWTTMIGWIMLGAGVVLLAVGGFFMMKLAKVEV